MVMRCGSYFQGRCQSSYITPGHCIFLITSFSGHKYATQVLSIVVSGGGMLPVSFIVACSAAGNHPIIVNVVLCR